MAYYFSFDVLFEKAYFCDQIKVNVNITVHGKSSLEMFSTDQVIYRPNCKINVRSKSHIIIVNIFLD